MNEVNLGYQGLIMKSKYEASQRIAQAEGEAKAIEIQAKAIQSQGGAEYVNLKAIKKWNGVLPVYTLGNSIPFVSLKNAD